MMAREYVVRQTKGISIMFTSRALTGLFTAALLSLTLSAQQIEAVTARLEALHGAQLLSDDELFALEDYIADFHEAFAACGVVTMEIVNTSPAMGKAHRLVALSEGMPRDAMFSRQLRRKFV